MCYLFMFIRVQFVKFLKNIETYKYLKHFIIYAIITPQMALTRLTPQDASHQVMVKKLNFYVVDKIWCRWKIFTVINCCCWHMQALPPTMNSVSSRIVKIDIFLDNQIKFLKMHWMQLFVAKILNFFDWSRDDRRL